MKTYVPMEFIAKQRLLSNCRFIRSINQFFLSSLILLIFSCNRQQEAYKKIIPEHDMIALLVDLHLSDGVIKSYINRKRPIYVKSIFYDSIFAKYHVTNKQFQWNLIHYSEEKKISGFYEKAISDLTIKKAAFEQNMLKENNHKIPATTTNNGVK